MRFILEIDCDNEAFGETAESRGIETARILNHVLTYVEDGEQDALCFDANGNRVGSARFEGR